jgi:histidinol dehydrogenase
MPAKFLKSQQPLAPGSAQVDVSSIVRGVIDDVRANGDAAVRKYSEKFDKWSPASFKLSQAEIDASIAACSPQTIEDIKQVQKNVRAFAQAQKDSLKDLEFEIQPVDTFFIYNVCKGISDCYRVSSLVKRTFLLKRLARKHLGVHSCRYVH